MYGLDTYDYGARQYDPVLCRWDRIDPLCEKYYGVSPYVYCMNNPVNAVDPDGRDWYKDKDKTYQYNPNVFGQKDLKDGQLYIGKEFATNSAAYRKDGSILFNNEKVAYKRIWSEANKKRVEEGAFVLSNGKILILPDYKNDQSTAEIGAYGFQISNHRVKKGNETFNVVGQIHTHQKGCGGYPYPSDYLGDDRIAASMKIPVFSMGYDGNIWGIVSSREHNKIFQVPPPLNTIKSLLNSDCSFAKYLYENRNNFTIK